MDHFSDICHMAYLVSLNVFQVFNWISNIVIYNMIELAINNHLSYQYKKHCSIFSWYKMILNSTTMPSYYLNQWSIIVTQTLTNKLQLNLKHTFIKQNQFENYGYIKVSTWSKAQYINYYIELQITDLIWYAKLCMINKLLGAHTCRAFSKIKGFPPDI